MNAPITATLRHRQRRDPNNLIDRVEIESSLAALRIQHREDTAFRRAVVDLFRNRLDGGRALARGWFEADGQGLACARHFATLQDELIRAIHLYVVTYLYPAHNPSAAERLAIVAVGGYGRDTLAPGSDIDLLFLHPSKQTAWGESVVEGILYLLWDLRQKVGHATRSVADCLRQADDMTVRTSMLESRLIDGDRKLFDDLIERFDREIVSKTPREFVAAKLAERDQRIARAGSSRYVVQPNVKEGKGGLRDLNTLFWISKYVYRVRDAGELVAAGLFTSGEFRLFRRCEEFLWRVRCHLHFVAGRAEERLSFDFQRTIANRLGYVSRGGLSAVERFMKHYFLVAKDVGDLTAIVCAALEERQAKPRAMLDRFLGGFRRKRHKIKGMGDFAIEVDRITIAAPDVFERDPINLIRLFWLSAENDLPIHPDAARRVTLSLKHLTQEVRNDPEANRLFIEILTSRNAPEVVLRHMNETGVLGRFIPEFGRVVAMMQFNMYHHYTVDEHLLRTIGVLSEIDNGRLKEDHPVANAIMPSIANRRALFVATMLHDIAKGRPEDHSLAGAEIARRLCPRLGLTRAETETVSWLVEHHLVMSTTAQSRDLSDRRTIMTFAGIVQSLERLRLLLVLTVADIRAVGPGVWNGWKGQLLRTLYWETEVVLAGGHSAIERNIRVAQAREELRAKLPEVSDDDFAAYASRHYQAYWLKVELNRKLMHHKLLRKMDIQSAPFANEIATDAFLGVTELTVIAADHPRILSIIAGACAAAGANIVDAQIFTTTDGLALDTIFISRALERDEDELRRAKRIAGAIEKSLRGEIRVGELVARQGASAPKDRAKTFPLSPEVIVDNTLSGYHTVLEVSGLDRPGLLFDLTTAISRLNLNIGSAHVATFGERAVDVFYVTDLTGAKVTSAVRQASIKRHLTQAFGGTEEFKARRASA